MTDSATITFSQPGVQPPVYVVTPLSEPPWQPVEMNVVHEKTTSQDLTFSLHFANVPVGDHQYKIRIGDGHWVVDETKDSTADEHGNRNNVIHVKPASESESADLQVQEKPTDPAARRKDSTREDELPNTSIPFVVVEKVADKEQPEYGDTEPHPLNMDAAKRTADAEPDLETTYQEIPIDTDHMSPGAELDRSAPLFEYELAKPDESQSTHSLDAIDETGSSADQTSSSDAFNTPSEPEEEGNDEPLLPHEMGPADVGSGGPNGYRGLLNDAESDEETDELDAAPLFSHEIGVSRHANSVSSSSSSQRFVPRTLEPDEAPTFTHEDADDDGYQEDNAPLLSHERGSALDDSSPEESGQFMLNKQPTFDYEHVGSEKLFGRVRPNIFRSRSNSSTLPHSLPRSDAEDENLHDPLLERFPTQREQILQRVASIGLQLPEDHVIEEPLQSPVMSVLSQACSSVDLAPVKSYTSLASVPEADDSDESDELESLPSPMVLNMGRTAKDFAQDPHATPMPKDFRSVASSISDAGSVGKNDGAKDVLDASSPPINSENGSNGAKHVLKPISPPHTSENNVTSSGVQNTITTSEPQLRQRQMPKNEAPTDYPATPATQIMTFPSAQPIEQPKGSFLQNFLRVVFGPIGHIFTACLGDRKRAGAVLVLVLVCSVYVLLATA